MIPLSYWYLGKEGGGNVGQASEVGEEEGKEEKGWWERGAEMSDDCRICGMVNSRRDVS